MSRLHLCGLALANPSQTEGELASFELPSCDLAVLSAGDTARCKVRNAGQPVASLQKALQMAGAHSVITGLWKVPDTSTKELRFDFYRRSWVERKPTWQALWEARLALRDAKDERGQPKYALRDWAARVLTGEPD